MKENKGKSLKIAKNSEKLGKNPLALVSTYSTYIHNFLAHFISYEASYASNMCMNSAFWAFLLDFPHHSHENTLFHTS